MHSMEITPQPVSHTLVLEGFSALLNTTWAAFGNKHFYTIALLNKQFKQLIDSTTDKRRKSFEKFIKQEIDKNNYLLSLENNYATSYLVLSKDFPKNRRSRLPQSSLDILPVAVYKYTLYENLKVKTKKYAVPSFMQLLSKSLSPQDCPHFYYYGYYPGIFDFHEELQKYKLNQQIFKYFFKNERPDWRLCLFSYSNNKSSSMAFFINFPVLMEALLQSKKTKQIFSSVIYNPRTIYYLEGATLPKNYTDTAGIKEGTFTSFDELPNHIKKAINNHYNKQTANNRTTLLK